MGHRCDGELPTPDEAQALFTPLFLRNPSPMWIYDPATLRFLLVNDAAIALYGFTRSQYAEMTLLDIRPASEHTHFFRAVEEPDDLGQLRHWLHMKASGQTMDVVTVAFGIRFAGGEAVLVVVSDMTALTEARRKASESRALLDTIVANLPIGVFVKDLGDDLRYLLYNDACAEIVGMDGSRIVGQTDLSLFSPEQGAEFRRQDMAVLESQGSATVEEIIPRPSGEERLVRTIKRVLPPAPGCAGRLLLGVSEDVTERRSYQARIAHLAMHDTLTGLPNRAAFTDHMDGLFGAAAPRPFALMLIDIDHFKVINDSMGHPAGDALLREVGMRLAPLVGRDGLVARLGGDEFALILMIPPGQGEWSAIDRTQRVMTAFAEPFLFDGAIEHVAASVGVALAPEQGADVSTLFRNADLALYAAKGDGRSTFRFYETSFRLEAENRHALSTEMRRALTEGEFVLFFQPILNLRDDRISGFEALIRWHHPERGLLGPCAFIPVAEETGLINAVGEWVIREACRAAAGWPKGLTVAVNLSALQFKQVGLLAHVVAALDESGLRPDRLELEVTESVLLSDSHQNLQVLHALRALGIRVAMDDFGTGYSSLSNLRSFPFSKIKMDRSFTAGIGSDPGSLAIARAVMGLGSGFNLVTTAEGVETIDQLERLRGERFSEVQGYLIAKPMPAEDVMPFLAGRGEVPKKPRRRTA